MIPRQRLGRENPELPDKLTLHQSDGDGESENDPLKASHPGEESHGATCTRIKSADSPARVTCTLVYPVASVVTTLLFRPPIVPASTPGLRELQQLDDRTLKTPTEAHSAQKPEFLVSLIA